MGGMEMAGAGMGGVSGGGMDMGGMGMLGQPDLRVEIIRTLGKIGPEAKTALPLLKEIVSKHAYIRTHAEKAISEIEAASQNDQR